VSCAGSAPCPRSSFGKNRKQNGSKYADYGDNDKQLNERETASVFLHGKQPLGRLHLLAS
jgi:hypothetical protein